MHEGAVEEGVALAEDSDGIASLDLGKQTRCGFLVEGIEGSSVIRMLCRDFRRHRIGESDLPIRILADDGIGDGACVAAPPALAEMNEPVGTLQHLAGAHGHVIRIAGAKS